MEIICAPIFCLLLVFCRLVALPARDYNGEGKVGRRPFRACGAEPKNAAGGAFFALSRHILPRRVFPARLRRAGRRPKSKPLPQSVNEPPRQPPEQTGTPI